MPSFLYRALPTVIAGSIGGFSVGALQQGGTPPDCLRAQRLEIVNKDGRTCCTIASSDDGTVELALAASQDGPRVLLRVEKDNSAFAGIENRPGVRCVGMTADGRQSAGMHVGNGHNRPALIALSSDESAMIGLAGSSGEVTWTGSVNRLGESRLLIGTSESGQLTVISDGTKEPSLRIMNVSGEELARLPK